MKKYLIAIIEREDGSTYEQTIAFKDEDVDEPFTTKEKRNAIAQLKRMLGKGYIICDTYEYL